MLMPRRHGKRRGAQPSAVRTHATAGGAAPEVQEQGQPAARRGPTTLTTALEYTRTRAEESDDIVIFIN